MASRSALCVLVALIACLPLLADLSVVPGKAIANEQVRIETIDRGGATVGLRVLTPDRELATILLGPAGLITAEAATTQRSEDQATLILSPILRDDVGRLGEASRIDVTIEDGSPWPRVSFSLHLEAFNESAWEQAVGGPMPFHYLLCRLPGATMFYQGGGLIPSPQVDPFPMTAKTYMAGEWADGWSYAPAMSGWAVPAVGLWNHEAAGFIGYDFNEARHTDRSSKFIASAYHTGAEGSDFYCLVHPYQKRWAQLTYPQVPSDIASRFELIWSVDMPDEADPNQFVLQRLWQERRDLLPRVPRGSDMAWSPQYDDYAPSGKIEPSATGTHLTGLSGPRGLSGVFVELGSRMLGNWIISDGIMRARALGDKARLQLLKRDVEYLIDRCTWVEREGERCATWVHPIEGKFKDRWGGERCAGIYHTRTFQIGAGMLGLYEITGDDRLLPFIDGVYNWCKHYLYTRNGVCDLPWAMFSRVGTAAGENFLLNYRRIFREDPDRKANYDEALRLARTSLYKVLWFYTADPDLSDDIDPSFLNQAVNDSRWIGRVTWNECGWVVRTLVPMYCETGDPFMKYILRGALERYYVGFRDDGGIAENLQISGEIEPKGLRTGGFSNALHGANVRRWARPCGDAKLRVAMGERAAIAFGLDTAQYEVADYRFKQASGFRFRIAHFGPVKPAEQAERLNIIATAPFRDLRGMPIRVDGQLLEPDRYEVNSMTLGEDVYIRGVRVGATIEIGDTQGAEALPPGHIPYREPGGAQAEGWNALDIAPFCSESLDMTWWAQDAWYGLAPGVRRVWGMPVALVDPALSSGHNAVTGGFVPLNTRARAILAVFGAPRDSEAPQVGSARLRLASGQTRDIIAATDCPIDLCNGFPLRRFDTYLAVCDLGREQELADLEVTGGTLLAVTLAGGQANTLGNVLARARLAQARALARKTQLLYQAPLTTCAETRPWAVPEMPYRFRFEVLPTGREQQDAVVCAKEDTAALLSQIGEPRVALRGFRAFEVGSSGNPTEVPVQLDALSDNPERGELMLLMPGKTGPDQTRQFDVYCAPDPLMTKAAVRTRITDEAAMVRTGPGGLLFEFTLSGEGSGPYWSRLTFDRNGNGQFEAGEETLGPSGFTSGYGALTCVTDYVTWYDFGRHQQRPARAQLLHSGPVCSTLKVSGLELWGEGDRSTAPSNVDGQPTGASPKGDAVWYFRFYTGKARVDQWVDFHIENPDTGWTRAVQVRYGLRRWEQGAAASVEGISYGRAEDLAILPLTSEDTRLPVACAFTPDGNVLGALFTNPDVEGDYFTGRWVAMPGGLAEAGYLAAISPNAVRQSSLEVYSQSRAVAPEPRRLQVTAFDSTGGRGPAPMPTRPEAIASQGNLVPDPSFEQTERFWALGSGESTAEFTTTQAYTGRTGVDLSCTDEGLSLIQTNTLASRQMGLQPNSTYEVSLWANCVAGPGELNINFYHGGPDYDFLHAQVELPPDGEWRRITVKVPVGSFPLGDPESVFPRGEEIVPALRVWTLNRKQRVYIDHVEVHAVP